MKITFRPMNDGDMVRFLGWLQLPHVRQYWQEPGTPAEIEKKFLTDLLERSVRCFIIEMDEEAIGYIQYYEACRVGRGIGSQAIRQFVHYLFEEHGAIAVISDPEPGNVRAIRAYEKVGFVREGPIQTPNGEAVLMRWTP